MDLLWCDLETTGLDPTCHDILEVHVSRARLEDPFSVREILFDGVLCPEPRSPHERTIDPIVIDMHTKNGLWVECETSSMRVIDVEELLLGRVSPIENPSDRPVLAGNSVHFDLGFLRVHMPRFAARLSHRCFDVSAVALFARALGMPKLPKEEAHRAKADVLASIRLASACASYLMNINAGP